MNDKTPLEILMDDWEKDAPVDRTEPGKEVTRIPNLHAKYARTLSKHNLIVKKLKFDLATLIKRKTDYFSGRMDQEQLAKYGLTPFKFVLKDDIVKYVDADDEIIKLRMKIALHEEVVTFAASVIKQLNDRTYQLGHFIQWERFIGGQ